MLRTVLFTFIHLFLLAGCSTPLERAERALADGDLLAAEGVYREMLAERPDDVEALYGLGWTWHLAGQTDAAEDTFRRCITVNPESSLGYKGLGSTEMARGNTAAARRAFEEAQKRAPDDLAIRHSVALLELSTGRHAEALALFSSLSDADPKQALYHLGRAEALLWLDRDEEALSASASAVELASDRRTRALSRINRARVLVKLTQDRVTPERCETAALPVYAWLEEAERLLDEAEVVGIVLPELGETRRVVRRRRGAIDDLCPGHRAAAAAKVEDG